MDIVEIKYLLAKKGISFYDIDRANSLLEGTISLTLAKPHAAEEQALARATGILPYKLFPERYDGAGKRLKPQPTINYNYKLRKKKFQKLLDSTKLNELINKN